MRRTFATALRVLRQLLHDKRTIALIFVVPCVLLGLWRGYIKQRRGSLTL